ncbi:MAG: serine/threonine-protein kinase [Pirellulaceae bacterium]
MFYTLKGEIGTGAVGIVRRAVADSGGEVAIKFLAPDPKYIELSSFDDVAERFRHEGIRGSRLDHARLVRILDYAENRDGISFSNNGPSNPFIAMERVHGRTLESYIKKTPKELRGQFFVDRERLFIALQLADALTHIHGKKIVHRDVKPANIFISSRTTRRGLPLVKLGDFGVVKWGDFHQSMSTGTLTMTHHQGLGTLKYMSPEQAIKPKGVTSKSDIYSFGITLYELFTGEVLASPHHVFQIMNARLTRGDAYAKFLGLGHDISGCETLCEKLLDCFLRGTDGRPKSKELLGCLAAQLSRLGDNEWTEEFI